MKCTECPEYNECSKKYNLAIRRRRCPKAKEEKVVTNGDRIRAMSDEELAKFLAERFANETCNRLCEDNLVTATQITAITHTWYCCWMDWLRRPAEGSQ